jgi:hypothetical protein
MPCQPPTAPTHAYRTPPLAHIQSLSFLSGDGDDDGDENVDEMEEAVREGDDADRVQWAQHVLGLARDRAAAERQMKEWWGHLSELLGLHPMCRCPSPRIFCIYICTLICTLINIE